MAREGHDVLVDLPLGLVRVRLYRWAMALSDRGGFEAKWAGPEERAADALSLEAYRLLAKRHLREVHRQEHGRDPSAIPLNLASHALADDLVGWAKLNYRA